jgi:anti-sigma factor RsiW
MSNVLHRLRFRLDHRWAPAHMSDYLDADLATARRRRLERHVGECRECERTLAGLRALLGALNGLPAQAGAADAARIAASVRSRLEETREPG